MNTIAIPVRTTLTAAQRGIWVAQRLDPTNPSYNCGGYLELRGDVRIDDLRKALDRCSREYDILRTTFCEHEGTVWQELEDDCQHSISLVALQHKRDPHNAAIEHMRTRMAAAMDPLRGPLVEEVLFTLGNGKSLLFLRFHHILMDGYSHLLYWRRLGEHYSAIVEQRAPAQAPSRSLATIVDAQRAYVESSRCERDRAFWTQQTTTWDPDEVATLGGRATLPARGIRRRSMSLTDAALAATEHAASELGTRWSVFMLAAVSAYLHRYSGKRDVVLGLPVTTRLTPDTRETPCMLANELPLHVAIEDTTTLADLSKQVSSAVGSLLKHQRYRGEEVAAAQDRAAASVHGTPVVNIVSLGPTPTFAGLEVDMHFLSSGPIRDLKIDIYRQSTTAVAINFDANPDLFSGTDLAAHQARFARFLHALCETSPTQRVAALPLVTDEERDQILAVLGDSARPYDLTQCLHQHVWQQAARTPEAIAVESENTRLTYADLMATCKRASQTLRERGVEVGDRVGVLARRSVDMVVALLSIMDAGAAYLPLDPDLPVSRLKFMTSDASVALVLSQASLQSTFEQLEADTMLIDEAHAHPAASVKPASPSPHDPAYVIYTSGSTGQPKGVVVPHRGIVNRLQWMQEHFALTPGETVLQKTTFAFDVSVWEFFWPLIVGARLFMAPDGQHRDPRRLIETMKREGVTTVHFVPPMLDLFLAEPSATELPKLARVICSGEALNPSSVGRFFEVFDDATHNARLHNLYGPTEASVDVTAWRCSPSDADRRSIPIGRPVANTSIYILDAHGHLAPLGSTGELCIGGVQVANGYLERPELTASRFVDDPFGEGAMYKTGDLARISSEGVVEFAGRVDFQVKVRGFRIELGEIERALRAQPAVERAVVTTWQRTDDDRRIVAYLVGTQGNTPDAPAIEVALRETLPDYMVPAHFVVLDALPLSPNGKVARKALPAPKVEEAAHPTGQPLEATNDQDAAVLEAWTHVLGIAPTAASDSFFSQGGDSMSVLKLRAQAERHGLTFDVDAFFEEPTLASLRAKVRPHTQRHAHIEPWSMLTASDRAKIPQGIEDAFPLSAMQRGMLLYTDLEHAGSAYRVVTSLHIEAALDLDRLRLAIERTMQRHPLLRCSFDVSTYSVPLQLVHEHVDVRIDILDDLSDRSREEQDAVIEAWAAKVKHTQFDPAKPPLLFFAINVRGPQEFQFSVVEHHVVLDGWSDSMMFNEIIGRYESLLQGDDLLLPAIASDYRSFVAAERAIGEDAQASGHWSAILEGAEPSVLPRMSGATSRAVSVYEAFDVPLDPPTVERLRALAKNEGLPLKAMFVAAHLSVQAWVCNQSEVLTGVISNGRLEQPGADEVIGVFLNTLPLRVETEGQDLLALARAVFDAEVSGRRWRRFPFTQMLRESQLDASLDSYVNFMDFHGHWSSQATDSVRVENGIGVAETNFPLAVNFLVDPVSGDVRAWIDCDVSQLDTHFAKHLAASYGRILAHAAESPHTPLADFHRLGAAEAALVSSWQGTAVDLASHRLPLQQIAAAAKDAPERVALVGSDAQLDYRTLVDRTRQLANHLAQQGVRPGDRVGVCVERGSALVVALLAVMQAGAAYVPLDPTYPQSRLSFIVDDAQLRCVLTDEAAPTISANVVLDLCERADEIAALPARAPQFKATHDDIAYVLYTSGSTGRPKGTQITHRNLINFFVGMDEAVGIAKDDVLLALTSVSFDISVLELLWPLTRGAQVVVAPANIIENLVPSGDPSQPSQQDEFSLAQLLHRHQATMLQSTPSLQAAMVDEPQVLEAMGALHTVLVGGEAFPTGLADRLLTALPKARVINMYGPTETTIWSTTHQVTREDVERDTIPIGRPITNTSSLVLDGRGRPVPAGVSGELWLGGEGVARGYWHRRDQTAQRFAAPASDLPRMYRTGDRVRWRADGVLEFLGRVDRQLKIRGHRIEPDEIESVLSRHPKVREAAVVGIQPQGGRSPELIAFVTPSANVSAEQAEGEHVEQWKEIWEGAYTPQSPQGDARFLGWNSSYDEKPIPAEHMQSWLDTTLERIDALTPRAIVDVGVGVGLVLRRFAGAVDRYHGIDISPAALEAARASVEGRASEVALRCGDAMQLEQLDAGQFDTIVLNSVIQYFPGTDYLLRVLREASRVAGPQGATFVGDVRSLDWRDAFYASVLVHRMPAMTPAPQLAKALAFRGESDRELCVHPQFFFDLAAQAGLPPPRIRLKAGPHKNELTRFRYDVVLYGPDRAQPQPAAHVPFESVEALRTKLERLPRDGTVRITDIPNARLVGPLAAAHEIRNAEPNRTAWDIERSVWETTDPLALDPDDVLTLAGELGFEGEALIRPDQRPHLFDVELRRQENAR